MSDLSKTFNLFNIEDLVEAQEPESGSLVVHITGCLNDNDQQ